jgi:hypothetical protein
MPRIFLPTFQRRLAGAICLLTVTLHPQLLPLAWSAGPQTDRTEVELIGIGRIRGDQRDKTGLSENLDDGTPHDQFGGISGIDYAPDLNLYFAVSDRGAKDGEVDYLCRFHELQIEINPNSQNPVQITLVASILLKNQQGLPYPGAANAFPETAERARRFDPEGIRLAADQALWISDEYGPYLIQFDRQGHFQRELAAPKNLLIEYPSSSGNEEDRRNQRGRRSNRGMEGLALTPCGLYLVGMMQSALLQDSYPGDKDQPIGLHARIVRFDLQQGTTAQYVYRQEQDKNKMHEILAIDSQRFLVIEQDGKPGAESKIKSIFEIDLQSATDVSDIESLSSRKLPKNITPVSKKLFLDLLDERLGLAATLPEKIEGLCFGPRLENGKRTLMVVSDNDFKAAEETLFYVFAF